jgi:hypothetical protein
MPLSVPLCLGLPPVGEGQGKGEVKSICSPKDLPAPEGRHNLCRGREAPGLDEKKLLPIPTVGSRHRHVDVGPPGLKNAIATLGSNKIANHRGFTRAECPCHDVGIVNDSLFTQKTSPGGAA